MSDQGKAPKQLGDLLGEQVGAMEASTLILVGMFNKLSRRLVAAGMVDTQWMGASFDELAAEISKVQALRDNPEVKRRLPIMKSMLLDGLDTPPGESP